MKMIDSRVSALPRTITRKGTGLETPNYGSSCHIKLKIFPPDGTVLHNAQKKVVIGEGDSEVSETLDKCLECMHAQEICLIPFDNEDLCQELGIVYERDLKCEIELLSFSKAKEPWETIPEDKMSLAKHHKEKGTDCFKSGNWTSAARRYSQALKQLILIEDKLSERKEDQEQLRATCLLNLSACQGKLGQYDFVALNCTKVLSLWPTNVKALFRRGQAFVILNEFEKAREDLEKALTYDPSNRAVKDQLRILKQKEQKHDEKLSNALGVMFGRNM
ncbi:Peptidyl-prolyl cis-trans isomerase FKBP62 [Stylophora pistillata]|uniref:Peptidyl-prolyl cis-trans isomerase FKBP62 n=2 Tax=Stylophora pistillata TaxID=50429 RepID=A0A2B4RG75_STYPI|nr:Peptidyl-prolyl cis-trans isomerase FKBP62 [Stylophora pistillata]